MRSFYISLFFSIILCLKGFSQIGTLILEGNYQGKNVYIQNPNTSSGVGFCVTEVLVNGNITADELNLNAFEIDLKAQKLTIGQKLEIKVKYKDDCKPKVLNPEVLKPKSTFEIVSIKIEKDGLLKWSSKLESGKLTYAVEQFRWNKWVKVGEVEGFGTPSVNGYSFKVTPHSGKNQIRVRQTDYTGQARLSKPVDFVSDVANILFSPIKASKTINFSFSDKPVETMYEIYDQYGNIVKRGFGSTIDVSNLLKGGYFLNYDNKMGEFIKK
jgi:hypothetical protein